MVPPPTTHQQLRSTSRANATGQHEPTEIHELINDDLTEDSPLMGLACRTCTPKDLITDLDAGELIDTERVVWWPCDQATEKSNTKD